MKAVEAGEELLRRMTGEALPLYKYQKEVLEAVDDTLFEGGVIIAKLPTGYGKTLLAAAAGLAAITEGAAHRVIHTYPATSMIQHVTEYGKELKAFEATLKEWLGKDAPMLRRVVAARHEFRHESPMLTEPYVVTTLDTLVMHYLKTRYAQEKKRMPTWRGTYSEFSAGVIRNSVLVFDEAHMYPFTYRRRVGEGIVIESVGKAVTVMAHIMGEHASLGGTAIMMSATLPDQVMRAVKAYLRGYGVRVREIVYRQGEDASFEERRRKNAEIRVTQVSTDPRNRADHVGAVAADILYSGDNIPAGATALITMNTVRAARIAYNRIREICGDRYDVILIHGSFTRSVTERKLNAMKELLEKSKEGNAGKGVAVVSTQVVEASIDEDFDTLITEAAPLDSIIQRMGRLQRRGSKGRKGLITIIKPVKEGGDFLGTPPYEKSLTENSLRIIEEALGGKEIEDLVNEVFLNSTEWVTRAYRESGYVYLNHDQELVDFLNLLTIRTPPSAVERFQRYVGGLIRSGLSYKALLVSENEYIEVVRAYRTYASESGGSDEVEKVLDILSTHLENGDVVRVKEWEITDVLRKVTEKIREGCGRLNIFGTKYCPATTERGEEQTSYPVAVPAPRYVDRRGIALEYVAARPTTQQTRLKAILREGAYLILPKSPDVYTGEYGLNVKVEVEES